MTVSRRHLEPGEVDHEVLWLGVGAAVVLLGLAMNAGASLSVPGCPFKAVTGWPCLGCGTTRALLALARGEWLEALRFNPLAALVAAGWFAWSVGAVASLVFGLPRWRVDWSDGDLGLARRIAGTLALACWMFLVADGR